MQNISMHHRRNFALVKVEKKIIKQESITPSKKSILLSYFPYIWILYYAVIFYSIYLHTKGPPCSSV